MLPTDLSTLRDRLSELAELFEKKPITDKALRVWFDVLKEFPIEKVAGLLISWPKSHTKFPAPAELWKSCNEIAIAQREKKAAEENRMGAFEPGVGGAKAAEFIAKMREILKQPAWTPEQHWRNNLKRFPKGHIGHEAAIYALAKKGLIDPKPQLEREPGQDDEELAA